MPAENLQFIGINRAISDFSPSSACEELINLRPSTNGLVPVKPFGKKMQSISYGRVYIHESTNGTKYIGVKIGASTIDIDIISGYGVLESHLAQISISQGVNENITIDDINFAFAGNIILFSICDRQDNYYKTLSYTWDGSSYKENNADVPPIYSMIYANGINDVEELTSLDTEEIINGTWDGYADTINNLFNKIQEDNRDTCFGPVIVAIALKTKAGQTFWTDKWYVFDPTLYVSTNSQNYYYESLSDLPEAFRSAYTDYFTKYAGYGAFYVAGVKRVGDSNYRKYVRLVGAKLTMVISQIPSPLWDKDKSIISSVEIYASRPRLYVDENAYGDGLQRVYSMDFACMLPRVPYADIDLQGQLLYHQRSISLETLVEGTQTFTLQFGGNIQIGEDTLQVDAGAVTRYGKILSFNARFHYYDSVSATSFTMPEFSYVPLPSGVNLANLDVCVKYVEGGRENTVFIDSKALPPISYNSNIRLIIAPSMNITEVMLFQYGTGAGNNFVRYSMTPSTTYNYSIWADGASKSSERISDSDWTTRKQGYANGAVVVDENNEINVTEQYSPFVFMVEHSYIAPGVVIDIQPQMAHAKDDTYGYYPLNVFTSRGVYALTQGSSNVLYGSFDSISNLISSSNAISTEMGTFFLASGAMWLIAGRSAILISDALSLGPNKDIRNNGMFQKISMYAGAIPGTYDVSEYLSSIPFDQFVERGATLSYNRFRDEIYVSNRSLGYSYALSLKHRQWFKISMCVWQDNIVGHLLNTADGIDGTLMTIFDMEDELDTAPYTPSPSAPTIYIPNVTFHLQSRPFTIGYQYIHVNRIVSMIRTVLHSGVSNTVIVALYGSDDLQSWNLITYASRNGFNGELKLSQVRTPQSSRSWRYYTIVIGGEIDTHTDLGPVQFDYQPVLRRIG